MTNRKNFPIRKLKLAVIGGAFFIAIGLLWAVWLKRAPDIVLIPMIGTTNVNQTTYVIRRHPYDQGKALAAGFVSYVNQRFQIETALSDSWTIGRFPSGPDFDTSTDLLYTPVPDTSNAWRLRLDYTQTLRFKNQDLVQLRRKLLLSPAMKGTNILK